MSKSTLSNGAKPASAFLKIAVSITLSALAVSGQPKTLATAQPLTLGKQIERELKGDEAHYYSLALQGGQFLNVVVEQKGIDVVVVLLGPGNEKLTEVDSPNGSAGPEPISAFIEMSGEYHLEVRSLEKGAARGRYEVRLIELRAATADDRSRIAATKAFQEAEALNQKGTREGKIAAITKYEEGLGLSRKFGDQRMEANAFARIGFAYLDLGNRPQALKYLTDALPIYRSIRDKHNEALTLVAIGTVSEDLGENQRAIELLNEAVAIQRGIGEKFGEATTLNSLGLIYSTIGEKQQALKCLNDALDLLVMLGEKFGQAITLNNIALVYSTTAEYRQALEFYNKALPLQQLVGNKRGEAFTLGNIGGVYSRLGDREKALKLYEQSLQMHRANGDRIGEADSLNNLGTIYSSSGENRRALEFYESARKVQQTSNHKPGEARTLLNIGKVHSDAGEYPQALEYFNDALRLQSTIGDKRGQAGTLDSISFVYWKIGDKQRALQNATQALTLMRNFGDKRGEADLLDNIGIVYSDNPRFNVFLTKVAVRIYQDLRTSIQPLDKNLQQVLLKSVEAPYRRLVDSLVNQNRLIEAHQTLEAFKDQQFFDFGHNKQALQLVMTPRESDLAATLNQTIEDVAIANRNLDEYRRQIARRQPTLEETKQVKRLEAAEAAASSAFQAFLLEASKQFSEPLDYKDKVDSIPDVEILQAVLRETSVATKQQAAAVYTLVGRAHLHALVITHNGIKSVSTPITSSVFNRQVIEFWALLQTPQYDTTKLAQSLYDKVFKPIEHALPNGTKTILWSLDGNLRYVPMAALYDGREYLVERYNHVNFTRADKERMTRAIRLNWTATAFGSSKELTVELLGDKIAFSPLPGVGEELGMLFRKKEKKGGIFDGEALEDAKFTQTAMLEALRAKRPLVHIASHFSFRPGDESRSFLLMGDGTAFTLADMKKHTDLFAGVEMLTLSACNTAAQQPDASGRDVDAFFELAQRLGANSVMATLWSVADNSTPWLMREFYRTKLGKKLSKAEALRRAQLSLLKGKAEIRPLATMTSSSSVRIEFTDAADTKPGTSTRSEIIRISKQNERPFDKTKHPPFAHPFYWSPFVLFGNWK